FHKKKSVVGPLADDRDGGVRRNLAWVCDCRRKGERYLLERLLPRHADTAEAEIGTVRKVLPVRRHWHTISSGRRPALTWIRSADAKQHRARRHLRKRHHTQRCCMPPP